jgi:hypothetical protein
MRNRASEGTVNKPINLVFNPVKRKLERSEVYRHNNENEPMLWTMGYVKHAENV